MHHALQAEPALVNALDVQGATPLHVAAHRGDADCVRLLLHARASVHARDAAGVTPLEVARDLQHWESVELLTKSQDARGRFSASCGGT